MKKRIIDLKFPLGGLNKRLSYNNQPPFSTVSCFNVRPDDNSENRERGGVRPPFRHAFSGGGSNILFGPPYNGGPVHFLSSVSYQSSGAIVTSLYGMDSKQDVKKWNSTDWVRDGVTNPSFNFFMSGVTWVSLGSSLNFAADHVMSAERGQKLYIADFGAERVSGTDGAKGTADNKLDAASAGDWTAHSIDTDNDVCVITNATNDLKNGVYAITSVASAEITLGDDIAVGATVGTCTFRIERGPKVLDPKTGVISLWLGTQTNEVQTLTAFNTPTGGTFTIEFDGLLTSDIAWNATAATIQTALENLPNIGSGNVSCSGGTIDSTAVVVTFVKSLRYQTVATLIIDHENLTGASTDNPDIQVVVTTSGKASYPPVGCTMIVLYRDRMVLAGDDNNPQTVYMSRQGDADDWDELASDDGRAWSGATGTAGTLGEAISCLAPIGDDELVIASKNGLWAMRGDPVQGGTIDNISRAIGIIDKQAWCRTNTGWIYFLSLDGLYLMRPESNAAPKSVSREKLPEDLINIDLSSDIPMMEYDSNDRGIHLMFDSSTDGKIHYWIDLMTTQGGDSEVSASFWPVVFGNEYYNPSVLLNMPRASSDNSNVFMGTRDGTTLSFQRNHNTHADNLTLQGGESGDLSIASSLWYGPIKLGGNSYFEGIITEMVAALDSNLVNLSWKIYVGITAQQAKESSFANSGDFGVTGGGIKYNSHPRCRGTFAYIEVYKASSGDWSLEELQIVVRRAGKRRI